MDELLNQLGKAAPESTAVSLLRAELLIAQDRIAEAEKLIETAREKNPGEVADPIALINLAIQDKRWDQASQTLAEAEKKLGDRAALRLARAALTRKGEKGVAEQIRVLAEKSKDFSAQEQVGLWQGLVSASLAVDDVPGGATLPASHGPITRRPQRPPGTLQPLAHDTKDVKLMDSTLEEISQV